MQFGAHTAQVWDNVKEICKFANRGGNVCHASAVARGQPSALHLVTSRTKYDRTTGLYNRFFAASVPTPQRAPQVDPTAVPRCLRLGPTGTIVSGSTVQDAASLRAAHNDPVAVRGAGL